MKVVAFCFRHLFAVVILALAVLSHEQYNHLLPQFVIQFVHSYLLPVLVFLFVVTGIGTAFKTHSRGGNWVVGMLVAGSANTYRAINFLGIFVAGIIEKRTLAKSEE